jgi:hypothetical protein
MDAQDLNLYKDTSSWKLIDMSILLLFYELVIKLIRTNFVAHIAS